MSTADDIYIPAVRQPDPLARRFLLFTSWLLIVAGTTLAVFLWNDPSISSARVIGNFAVAVIGTIALCLVQSGRQHLAAQLSVWGMWGIVSLLISRDAGIRSMGILSYPVILVASGWLMGGKRTYWLAGLTAITLILFAALDHYQGSQVPIQGNALVHLLFVLFVLMMTTGLTLMARFSYLRQIDEIARAADELAARDIELKKISQAVEQSQDNIIITNLEPRIEYVNDAFVANTGYSREEAIGQNPNMLRSGNTPNAAYEDLWAHLTKGLPWRGELLNRCKDGTEVVEVAKIAPIRGPNGLVTHYVAVTQDVTKIRMAESKIYRLGNFDQLTGLPNRASLTDRLARHLAVSRRQHQCDAILLLNIDRFKTVNDAGGRVLGDAVLIALGDRVTGILRKEDTLARLSADEFAILMNEPGDDRATVSARAMAIANKIQENLRQPLHCGGIDEIAVTVSLGISLYPDGADDSASDVLRRADTALHRARAEGGSHITFFDPAMGALTEQRFRTERELRRAIPAEELRLFLQPQVDAAGHLTGAEALVRWQHPERGLVSPGLFIPVAEETDLIVALGIWVTKEACRLMAAQQSLGLMLNISVNVSPRHFRQVSFVPWLMDLLSTTGADPKRLTLEVTEGLVIQDVDDVVAKMKELTSIGIHFSIDDFGTGYSSLAYLKRLPIDELKIDKTFVQDAPTNPDDAALVETILAVARQRNLKVVAEGVETQEQADYLNQRGTVIHQGYFFGRPEPSAVWIQRWHDGAQGMGKIPKIPSLESTLPQ